VCTCVGRYNTLLCDIHLTNVRRNRVSSLFYLENGDNKVLQNVCKSATGRSLVQRSPTECVVCLCVIVKPHNETA
jgi:hypothetical protein